MPRPTGLLLLAISWACACASKHEPSPPPAVDAGTPDAAIEPPPYGPEVRSLRVKRSIVVRLDPAEGGKPLGTVAQDTRVGFTRAAAGDASCPRWIEIAPRGWVCERYLEPSKKETRARDGWEGAAGAASAGTGAGDVDGEASVAGPLKMAAPDAGGRAVVTAGTAAGDRSRQAPMPPAAKTPEKKTIDAVRQAFKRRLVGPRRRGGPPAPAPRPPCATSAAPDRVRE